MANKHNNKQLSCSWTPVMVDSLVHIYADTISKAGKAADNGSLTNITGFHLLIFWFIYSIVVIQEYSLSLF